MKILLVEQYSQLGGEYLSNKNPQKILSLAKELEDLSDSSSLKIIKNKFNYLDLEKDIFLLQ